MYLYMIVHKFMLGVMIVYRVGALMETPYFHYYENMDDYFFTNFSIHVHVVRSSLECGHACLVDKCTSFTINNQTGSCRTYSNGFYYCSPGKIASIGTRYFVRRETGLEKAPIDCRDVQTMNSGPAPSGVYSITPVPGLTLNVLCEMLTNECPWTVFQNRYDGSLSFNRLWTDYAAGFGDTSQEFWLGNEGLAALTSSGDHECSIVMEDWHGVVKNANYRPFAVGDASSNYRLTCGNYTGTAGDAFSVHNSMMFSTPDKDNDIGTGSCASNYKAGWWYQGCQYANLNGQYRNGDVGMDILAMQWGTFHGPVTYRPLKKAKMMIRKLEKKFLIPY